MTDLNVSLKTLYDNLRSVVLGKEDAIFFLLVTLLARGHVLLEDVPGTGKTLLAKTVARSLHALVMRQSPSAKRNPSSIWPRARAFSEPSSLLAVATSKAGSSTEWVTPMMRWCAITS